MTDRMRAAADVAVKTCLAVKPSDRVLVITDTKLERIGRYFFEAAQPLCDEAAFVVIPPCKSHGEEPPEPIGKLMRDYDVLIIPTYRSMSHTEARREACKNGSRCATLPNITQETMKRAINADYDRISELTFKLAEILTKSRHARVITSRGTDVSFSLDTRSGYADTGFVTKPGGFSNLPAGEAYIAPVEGTSNGVVVVDGAIGDTGVLSSEDTITIDIRDGYAVRISGEKSAKRLTELMEPHGKEAMNVAELGIGTNYKAKLIGNILEDEKVRGTVHIAFGDNRSMGGNVRVASHLDGIILKPTLFLDDKIIMKDGKLRVRA